MLRTAVKRVENSRPEAALRRLASKNKRCGHTSPRAWISPVMPLTTRVIRPPVQSMTVLQHARNALGFGCSRLAWHSFLGSDEGLGVTE